MILMLEDEPFGSFFFGVSKKHNCCLCPSKASVGMTMDASEKTQKTPSPIPTLDFLSPFFITTKATLSLL